jgi:hypothetical protein
MSAAALFAKQAFLLDVQTILGRGVDSCKLSTGAEPQNVFIFSQLIEYGRSAFYSGASPVSPTAKGLHSPLESQKIKICATFFNIYFINKL